MNAGFAFQGIVIFLAAPLAAGVLRKLKAVLQNRLGAPVVQPYRDLRKLLGKEEVVSGTASGLFRVAPYVVFAATAGACSLVPVVLARMATAGGAWGDLVVLVGLLALGRFALALGALEAGSAFGGMGSSREMMVSSLAEPALLTALFVAALEARTSEAGRIAAHVARTGGAAFGPGSAFALAALFLVALAECGRLPVDNPSTHLELTMIHEAMILEYSGRSLALIEWASQARLLLFMTLLVDLFLPWGIALDASAAALALGAAVYALKIAGLCAVLAFAETSTAKLRLFRVPDFLGAAFVLALIGLFSQGFIQWGL